MLEFTDKLQSYGKINDVKTINDIYNLLFIEDNYVFTDQMWTLITEQINPIFNSLIKKNKSVSDIFLALYKSSLSQEDYYCTEIDEEDEDEDLEENKYKLTEKELDYEILNTGLFSTKKLDAFIYIDEGMHDW